MKKLILVLTIIIFCISCTKTKSQEKTMNTDFQFTECEALYQGKPLPFGKPIAEWEKIFGKHSRQLIERTYIWDDLGIAISAEKIFDENEKKNINKLFIFYSNLDSPAGQKGKLKEALDRKSLGNILEMYKKGEGVVPLNKQLEQEFINDKSIGGQDGPDKYIYPYITYKNSVKIDGSVISQGMSLKEINTNRKNLDLRKFTFRDNNMNMINERGTTKGDNGEYWDDVTDNRCEKQGFYILSSVQYSDSELEFINITFLKSNEDVPAF